MTAAADALPEVKLFGKWSFEDVVVSDISLEDYLALKQKFRYHTFVPHTAGRYQAKRFRKAQCPIVERLAVCLMRKGRNTGKKTLAVRIVQHAFEIVNLLTDQNPIQVLVDAVINSGPREDSTRIGSGGSVRRQAVDVSPLRRVNQALYLLTTGARQSAFRNVKTIAECLADELINASRGSSNSYAIKKKDEFGEITLFALFIQPSLTVFSLSPCPQSASPSRTVNISTSKTCVCTCVEKMSVVVRDATRDDLPAMHQLVVELAVFEREPDAVTADLEHYQQNFADGVFRGLVAVTPEGVVVGMAIFYITFSTWKGRCVYLEDLVVTDKWRRHGVGRALFAQLLVRAQDLRCKLVRFAVLDWNEPAIAFYRKLGASISNEWLSVRLEAPFGNANVNVNVTKEDA
jgi:small subunit ribosomal protein S5e